MPGLTFRLAAILRNDHDKILLGGLYPTPSWNLDTIDTDGDGEPDCKDPDDDNDGWSDTLELECGSDPLDATSTLPDTDKDQLANCEDDDDDGDG